MSKPTEKDFEEFGELLAEHLGAIQKAINPNVAISLFFRRRDMPGDTGWAITTETNPDPKEMGQFVEACLQKIIPEPVPGDELGKAMGKPVTGPN